MGGQEKGFGACLTRLHMNYKPRQCTDGQHSLTVLISVEGVADRFGKEKKEKLEKLKLPPALHNLVLWYSSLGNQHSWLCSTSHSSAGSSPWGFQVRHVPRPGAPTLPGGLPAACCAQERAALAGLLKVSQLQWQAEKVSPHVCFSTKHRAR